jgi:hypothetical protein
MNLAAADSPLRAYVIPAEEELMMAQKVVQRLNGCERPAITRY